MRAYWEKNDARFEKEQAAKNEAEFQKADKNHDGILSGDEVNQFLDETYNRTPAFNKFFKNQVDKNGDGQLNKDGLPFCFPHLSILNPIYFFQNLYIC